MGFYLVLLYLSHITGRKFTSFQLLLVWFFGFGFGLFKNRKHEPLFLFSGLLLEIAIVGLVTTGNLQHSYHRKLPLTY